ncbi:MAG: molybdopterin-dependent oxidoreductase, partial [Planctomycetota bacterium]|nr:molybdopterin-dependent oxidoreductase [Planctomycetota bacterium]
MAARDLHGPDAPWGDFGVVGQRNRKVDGMDKATGCAIYADDIQLPGMLYAKTLRSPHAHALIRSIDTAKAEALPGVYAVLVGDELPIPYGVIPWTQDEHVLAVEKVRFIGDEVAAVAAVDEDTANAALELIEVEYKPLRAFFDAEEALSNPEPAIHTSKKDVGNLSKHVRLEFGEVDAAAQSADILIDEEYSFHSTTHAAIEPHCAVAQCSPDGKLTLWSSTQITHYVHRALSRVLELEPEKIRVIQPYLGGAFGGKSDPFSLEFIVSALARKTGRPVKLLWTREEVFYAHRGRHAMKMKYRTSAQTD